MKPTIFIAISKWAVANLNVEESLKNVGVEVLQKCIWDPLKTRIIKFFSSEEEAQEFIEDISTEIAPNEKKPARDVEDLYERIKGTAPQMDLFNEIAAFFSDNQDLIRKINTQSNEKSGDTFTFYQKAENIYQSNGIQNIIINNTK